MERAVGRVRAGATLLELLIVLGILALAGLVAAPSVASWSRGSERRWVRGEVVAAVRGAQEEASARGLPVSVRYWPLTGEFRAGERRFTLPEGWSVVTDAGLVSAPASRLRESDRRSGVSARWSGAVVEVEEAVLLTWSPSGLPTPTRWSLVKDGAREIRVWGDGIEGVRVE